MADSDITNRMKQLGINEPDVEESFARSSGPGVKMSTKFQPR